MNELALAFIITGILIGALVGWNFAVHNHRETRKKLEANVDELEAQVANFTESARIDPQRAWIDMGKRTVLHQLETAVRTIRKTLDPDA
jgi:hypothetical protein